jgi:hypothetical protein
MSSMKSTSTLIVALTFTGLNPLVDIPVVANAIADKVANIIGALVFGLPGLPSYCAHTGIPGIKALAAH